MRNHYDETLRLDGYGEGGRRTHYGCDCFHEASCQSIWYGGYENKNDRENHMREKYMKV